ncbi:hypothetical protein SAMN02799630_00695 [Paenibacillus sp. UNCCL117]|uniref:hypothetical protein n=1 Tax=unclassified Paenibacillus TaxID=185978 RepID=UPI000887D172|nr:MULTISPECIES: hypothetical protein [unclassified Paenibacillus]SDC16497.1 hypothetical protein SAMN04488602_101494 [Paenibacillus sp. cl123]SFW17798.1 hypothetical protein SAMN02799630_00695 [Paenibacillus sp. UNCCL117]
MGLSRRKDFVNDCFELVLYAATVISLVYFLLQGNSAKLMQAVFIVGTLLLLRIILKLTHTELFPVLRFSVLTFIFITMIFANFWGFYGVIPYLDKIEHLLSGFILCFVGLVIFKKLAKSELPSPLYASLASWFSLFFAVGMAGCWEIFEFTGDRLLGFHSQGGSLVDTMADIICCTVTAIPAALYIRLRGAVKEP